MHDQFTPADLIRALTAASSIAVIGASDDGSKPSGRTLRYLKQYQFAGEIYPVNPQRDTVQGLRCYARLEDVPSPPDLAVIVLPTDLVAAAVEACGRVGVGVAIVYGSGYAEIGLEGAEAQAQLLATAKKSGVRILGPNCVGAVGAKEGVTATFMTGLDQTRFDLKDDGVAFVSQSGAMGAFLLSMAQSSGLGISRFVSTGNEADITLPEVIEGLVAEGSTRAILGYVEGIRDADRLRSALALARARRIPVGLMKVGRTQQGATAAQSHTGALAGEDAVYDGLFAQYGVVRATDIDHLLDIGRAFASRRRPVGPRVSIVTLSGGAGILMTDAAAELGLEVPRWNDEWAERMAGILPPYATVRNPIDTTGAVVKDQSILKNASEMALAHPGTDVVMVMIGNLDKEEDQVCDLLTEAAASSDKPLVVVWVGGSGRPVEILARRGIPAYPEPLRAMRAVSAIVDWGKTHGPGDSVPPTVIDPIAAGAGAANSPAFLDEVAAKDLLRKYGVSTVDEHEVVDADTAAAAAGQLGYPVVLKLLSVEVAHKSDAGFVRLGLGSPVEVRVAAQQFLEQAETMGIDDRRLVVQKTVTASSELIVGMRRDPVFGPVIVVGIGGVLTELTADSQLRMPPLEPKDARSMLDGLRYRSVLDGVRGRGPADREALVELILAFSRFTSEHGEDFDSFEMNPVLIDAAGQPVAVDALAVLRETGESSASISEKGRTL